MPLSNAEKQKQFRDRQKEKGLVCVRKWVPEKPKKDRRSWIIDQVNAMDDEELKRIMDFIKTKMILGEQNV
jgi:hypothetical protein